MRVTGQKLIVRRDNVDSTELNEGGSPGDMLDEVVGRMREAGLPYADAKGSALAEVDARGLGLSGDVIDLCLYQWYGHEAWLEYEENKADAALELADLESRSLIEFLADELRDAGVPSDKAPSLITDELSHQGLPHDREFLRWRVESSYGIGPDATFDPAALDAEDLPIRDDVEGERDEPTDSASLDDEIDELAGNRLREFAREASEKGLSQERALAFVMERVWREGLPEQLRGQGVDLPVDDETGAAMFPSDVADKHLAPLYERADDSAPSSAVPPPEGRVLPHQPAPAGKTDNPLLAAALGYAAEGMKVLPITPGGKSPTAEHGVRDATTDVATIRRWWESTPDANLAIRTGKESGIWVLDVDVKNGAGGLESLKELQDEHGKLDAFSVQSPSGGLHFYFTHPGERVKNSVGLRPGIDVSGDAGYVVAPPSSIDGRVYSKREESPDDIRAAPRWLLDVVLGSQRSESPSREVTKAGAEVLKKCLIGVDEGERNSIMFECAIMLRQFGEPIETAMRHVLAFAQVCRPPLPEGEARRAVSNAYGYTWSPRLTEFGNALRLVAMSKGRFCHVVEAKKWLYWDVNRWIWDEGDIRIMRMAKKAIKSLQSVAKRTDDEDLRKAIYAHARKSENLRNFNAMIRLASTEEDVPVRRGELDADPMRLGVTNGTIDLRSGAHLVANPEHLITKSTGTAHQPPAECPAWLSFLDQVMDGDQEMVSFLRRAVGYTLTGHAGERCFFILHGTGSNGKTTFLNIIRELLGDYATQAEGKTLLHKNFGGSSIPNDLAFLAGARFVTTLETGEGERLNEPLVKQLTGGGDPMTARKLYENLFTFIPGFKIWVATNHKLDIRGTDDAIWDRVRLVPFSVRVTEEDKKKNKDLPERLREELPGILNWALKGCLEWQESGLAPPDRVLVATTDYRKEEDIIQTWMDQNCEIVGGEEVKENALDLYQDFTDWAKKHRFSPIPSAKKFGIWMTEKCLMNIGTNATERKKGWHKKKTGGRIHYVGVRLRSTNWKPAHPTSRSHYAPGTDDVDDLL